VEGRTQTKLTDFFFTHNNRALNTKWDKIGYKLQLINPLKPELNPICYLLELLAHHFLHVSRI